MARLRDSPGPRRAAAGPRDPYGRVGPERRRAALARSPARARRGREHRRARPRRRSFVTTINAWSRPRRRSRGAAASPAKPVGAAAPRPWYDRWI